MARIARVVWPGYPYHVTHRAEAAPLFAHDEDYVRYLRYLDEDAERSALRIWAYSLLPDHVHLLVVPSRAESLARAVGNAHRRYSRSINRRRNRTGRLWASRFASTPLDARHLWAAVRYVEMNPVHAGLIDHAADYRWSSARAHVGQLPDPLLDPDRPFPGGIENWSRWLEADPEDPRLREIRRNTSTGRPTGSEAFVRDLERQLGRALRPGRAAMVGARRL